MAFPIPFPREDSIPEKEFWDSFRRLSPGQQEIVKQAYQSFLTNPNANLERKTGGKNLYSIKFGPKRDGRAIGWYKDGLMHWYWVGFDHNRYMRTLDAYVRAGY
jgi:hypothetical protein